MDRYRELLQAWKDADSAAKGADKELSTKFDAYLLNEGPMPTEAERQEVNRLRFEANKRLTEAIEYLSVTRASQ